MFLRMITSHIVRTSISLLVVVFLILAWPAQGQPQELESSLISGSGFDLSAATPASNGQEVRIIDNGLESVVKVDTHASGQAAINGKPLASAELQGLLDRTQSHTVAEFLNGLGYKIAKEDVVFPALNDPVPDFGQIIITRAPGVEVVHDGETESFKTRATTVKALLAEKKIKVGEDDRVEPELATAIVPNLRVQIFRVEFKEEQTEEAIDFETTVQEDPNQYEGEESVATEGQAGTLVKKYKLTIEDGEEVERELLSEEITAEPVTKVILKGTKVKPVYTPPANNGGGGDYKPLIMQVAGEYGVDGEDMYWLMMCESGGNPNASNGYNIGLFQFAPPTFDTYNVTGGDIWDATAQIYAAANLISQGGRGQWGC